jgi:putative transcriptional regulator
MTALVDVKKLRQNLKLTQQAFADRIGVPVDTLRKWEQGRRRPDGAARTLLIVLAHAPTIVEEAIKSAA